jgi:mannitol-1-/sugar-/sorbitol-6-phosphatase
VNDVEGVVPIDGVGDFIARLEPNEWAVVTSAPPELATVRMRAAKLPLPRVLVTSEDVRRGKPDPEGFLLAAERLGVRIEQCLVFEDSAAGVAAARASGAHVAIVGGHVPESDGDFALPNYL